MRNPSRRNFIGASAGAGAVLMAKDEKVAELVATKSDREYWLSVLSRIADPVLSALSTGKLKANMPVEAPKGNAAERRQYTHLEAFGRLLAGIARWIESGEDVGAEGKLRQRYAGLARQSMISAVDPSSPDYMNFATGQQPLVDAAFLALAVLRAPTQFWDKLDGGAKTKVVEALRASRSIRPGFNNWLLFSAMIEAFLCFAGERWDAMRVDYAVKQHEEWYKGDGAYGDGPQFHWDYYNSFVIHPFLLEVLATVAGKSNAWQSFEAAILARARRYAAIQELMIGPDGSYPPVGRSLTYRFGAFHLLAMIALRKQLPENIKPEQVRCALTAVIRRMMDAPGTFDNQGWLRIGFCGHQPSLGENYISTGSLYLCSVGLLPLGLPAGDPFWSGPPQAWSSRKIWSGEDMPADHAI